MCEASSSSSSSSSSLLFSTTTRGDARRRRRRRRRGDDEQVQRNVTQTNCRLYQPLRGVGQFSLLAIWVWFEIVYFNLCCVVLHFSIKGRGIWKMFQQFSLSARSPFFFLLLLRPKGLARAHESLNSVRFLLEATCVYHKIDVSIEREREREKGTAAKGKETKEKKKKKKKTGSIVYSACIPRIFILPSLPLSLSPFYNLECVCVYQHFPILPINVGIINGERERDGARCRVHTSIYMQSNNKENRWSSSCDDVMYV